MKPSIDGKLNFFMHVQERLEIVINTWVEDRSIPRFEVVSKVEHAALLNFFNGKLPS
jgi:hypothetical protein